MQRPSESLDKRNIGYASCFRPTHGDGPQMRIRLNADHLPGLRPSRGDRCDERGELPAHRPSAATKINNVIARLDRGRLNCPVMESPRRRQRVLIIKQRNHLRNRFVVLGRRPEQRWDHAGRLRRVPIVVGHDPYSQALGFAVMTQPGRAPSPLRRAAAAAALAALVAALLYLAISAILHWYILLVSVISLGVAVSPPGSSCPDAAWLVPLLLLSRRSRWSPSLAL